MQLEEAKASLKEGRLGEAEGLLQKLLQGQPNNAEAYHLLGLVYARKGVSQQAISALERATRLNPGSADAFADLGEVFISAGKRTQARETLSKSLSLKPDQPTVQYALGMLFLEATDYRQAETHLSLARSYGLQHSGVVFNLGYADLKLGRFDEAFSTFHDLLQANAEDASLHLRVGKLLFDSLLYQEAQPPLTRAWQLQRGSYEAGFYLALDDYLSGQPKEASKVLIELKARGVRSLELEDLLGCAYAKLGQTEQSVNTLRTAIQQWPDRPDPYFNLGLVNLEQGNRGEASTLLEKAGSLYHGTAKIFYVLGTETACRSVPSELDRNLRSVSPATPSRTLAGFYSRLAKPLEGKFQYTTAAELLRFAWEQEPDDPETLLRLGICCYNLDDVASSLALFKRVVALRPNIDRGLYFLGNAYASLGNYAEAAAAYRNAIQLAPNTEIYYYRIGEVFLHESKIPEAEQALNTALKLSPSDAAAHSALGKVYLRLHRDQLAAAEFEQAIALAPELPAPYYQLSKYYFREGKAQKAKEFAEEFKRKEVLLREVPGHFGYIRAGE